MVKEKPKYRLLVPRYRETLREIRQMEWDEEDAYSSDLDVDMTNESEFEIKEVKINFAVLIPDDHKFKKQFDIYMENICSGSGSVK